jgi:hypothetical protein
VRGRQAFVAIHDLAGRRGWPSRAALFIFVKQHKIARFKFPRDRKTYVRLSDLEKAMSTPRRKR